MKYAKYDRDIKRRETWDELVGRNEAMHIRKYPQLKDEIVTAYKYVYDKKVLPSMRSLQFGGKPIEISPNRAYNCAFMAADHPSFFSELMFLLLGGTGVGFSVQKHHVEKLPEIRKPNEKRHRRFLVSDSIEGWADAIKVLFRSYFEGLSTPVYDYSDIRKKNMPLITSGGKAPGPQPLMDCIHSLTAILEAKDQGEQLTPLEVHDCACHIADAVLSGGIRRAALLSLFSFDDEEMLTCKSGSWWELNPQRGRANNSACAIRHKITEGAFKKLWEKIYNSKAGEPGIYFSNDSEYGTNPCCFSGEAKLLTEKGYISFESLAKKGHCWLRNPFGKLVEGYVFEKGEQECVELSLSNGRRLVLTPDHVLVDENDMFVIAAESTDVNLKQFTTEKTKLTKKIVVNDVKSVGLRKVYDFSMSYDFTTDEEEHLGVVEGIVVHNCEIALRIAQFCNLTEINANDIVDQDDLNERARIASFIGTLQAGYTDFHYLREIWRKTTEREALLGVGITGICSGRILNLDLTAAAKIVLAENERVAKLIGIKPAARTTTVKPSGTTSLVLGCSSGIHGWHAPFYYRRIRVGKNEAIYHYLSAVCPELIEDDYFKPTIQAIIKVPQKAPPGSIFRQEPAIDLLE